MIRIQRTFWSFFAGLIFSKNHFFLFLINFYPLVFAFWMYELKIILPFWMWLVLPVGVIISLFSIAYYEYRYDGVIAKNVLMVESFENLPFAFVIFDNSLNCVFYNQLMKYICKNTNFNNFEEFLKLIELPDISEVIHSMPEALRQHNQFTKDVQMGKKKWRVFASEYLVNEKKYILLKIIDITVQEENPKKIQELIEDIINKIDRGILILSSHSRIVFANNALQKMTDTENVTGKNIKSFPILLDLITRDKNSLKLSNSTIINSNLLIKKEELEVYVTEHTVLHNQKLNFVTDDAPLGILTIDEEYNIITCNAWIGKIMLEINPKPKTLPDLVFSNDVSTVVNYLKCISNGKQLNPIRISFSDSASPLILYAKTNPNIKGLIVYCLRDEFLTEIQNQFLHEQRISMLGFVVGGLSHDLRNNLTSMLGFCDLLLQKTNVSSENYSYILHIQNCVSKSANLLNQMLDLSKKHALKEEVVNINDELAETMLVTKRLLGENIELKLIKSKETPKILMNKVQFNQIMLNLLINAKDAMTSGGEIMISVNVFYLDKNIIEKSNIITEGYYAEIAVKDNGSGIDPNNLEKIFKPYFTTKTERGIGLGLSTVQSLVRQKRGFIKVQSKIESGTTFRIYLPLYLDKQEAISRSFNAENKNNSILLVEDEVSVRLFASKGLAEKGFNVLTAESGEEAIRKADSLPKLGLLITDVMMSGMNGIILYEKLKQKFPNMAVIFISGYTEESLPNIRKMKEDKIYFLQKPFSLKELISVTESIL